MTNAKDPFAGMEEVEVKYNSIKFGKVGDWIRGTLVDNTRQIPNNLSPKKEMQTVLELKIAGGQFHDIIKKQVQETPTIPEPGSFWSYITGKPAILNQLKDVKLGQVIGFRFAEIKKSKSPGFDDTKIIKVYKGGIDPDYQGETSGD